MIDAESTIYDTVIKRLEAKYLWARNGKVTFANEFVIQPESFPFVSIVEEDNRTEIRYHDSGAEENAVRLTYQVDVWTNGVTTKKKDGRRIINAVDKEMLNLGFRRTYLNNVPDIQDVSIYRYIGRYTAICDETDTEFRLFHRS